MECTSPNYMVFDGLKFNGKAHFIFIPNKSYNRMLKDFPHAEFIQTPCGHCISCKIAYSRSWADRITLESKKYKDNYFITLTYDDDHLHQPYTRLKFKAEYDYCGNKKRVIDRSKCKEYNFGSLDKRDMQLFMKMIRKYFPESKIKFFGCGEYGDESLRCHLHIILLNCPLNDLTNDFIQMVDGKEVIYHRTVNDGLLFSKTIYNAWCRRGEISVAPFSYDTASYVAQYCQKKYDPKSSKVREELGYAPEFVLMSKGLGADYVSEKLYDLDNIVVNGHVSAVPRYFDKKITEKIGDEESYYLFREKRLVKKLRSVHDYKNGIMKKDKDRMIENYRLITKNKLRNKI